MQPLIAAIILKIEWTRKNQRKCNNKLSVAIDCIWRKSKEGQTGHNRALENLPSVIVCKVRKMANHELQKNRTRVLRCHMSMYPDKEAREKIGGPRRGMHDKLLCFKPIGRLLHCRVNESKRTLGRGGGKGSDTTGAKRGRKSEERR